LYAVNDLLGCSAFLSVFGTGIVLGNSPWGHRDINIHFFERVAWLMETSLFLILGLQVCVKDFPSVLFEGVILAAILIL